MERLTIPTPKGSVGLQSRHGEAEIYGSILYSDACAPRDRGLNYALYKINFFLISGSIYHNLYSLVDYQRQIRETKMAILPIH